MAFFVLGSLFEMIQFNGSRIVEEADDLVNLLGLQVHLHVEKRK